MLQENAGFIRHQLSQVMRMRTVPALTFRTDGSMVYGAKMDELFKKIQQGDKKAREEYINGNLKLVLSVIRKFNNRKENPDALFQIGCVGLIKAINSKGLRNSLISIYYNIGFTV